MGLVVGITAFVVVSLVWGLPAAVGLVAVLLLASFVVAAFLRLFI